MLKQFIKVMFPLALLSLGGCARSLVMETTVDVPEPLVQPLPLNVAIYHPEQTRDHIYQENTKERSNWSITTGPSQVALFDRIFSSMFESAQSVNDLNALSNQYDAVIVPTIKDMQFSVPRETRLKIYEVWVLYEVSIQKPQGEIIATFPISGYGKSPTEFFKRAPEGLRIAANKAFRDLGAKLIIGFNENPDIEKWFSARPKAKQGK